MSKKFEKLQPLIDELDDYLSITAPPYLVYQSIRNGKRATVVEVEDASSDPVIFRLNGNQLVEVVEAPF